MDEKVDIIENGVKLGSKEPYDITNPDHNDPKKYKIYNGTVFDHVIAALKKNKIADPLVNLSILMHDVGKGLGYEGGENRFFRHAEKSKDLIEKIAERLRLTNKEKDAMLFSALNHMKMMDALNMKPTKIMRLVNDDNWEVLKAVSYCDDACRIGLFDKKKFNNIINNMEKIAKRYGNNVNNKVVKIIDGKSVMEWTGLNPGKEVGEIIKKVTDEVVNKGSKEPIDKLIKKVYGEIK